MLANPARRVTRRRRLDGSSLLVVSAIVLLALLVALVCAWFVLQTVAGYYAGRVYPNVYTLGLKLGRLSPEEAAVLLREAAPPADQGLLVLQAGEERWSIPWSQAGMQLDVDATVQAAFAIGHSEERWRGRVRAWLARHDVAPVFSVNEEQARSVLEQMAAGLAIPPTDATIRLPENGTGAVEAVPGSPGRALDVPATLERVLAAAHGAQPNRPVDLVFQSVPPQVTDVTPFIDEIETMLNRRIELYSYDVLTDESFAWVLDRDEIVTWLRAFADAEEPSVGIDTEAVQATLSQISAGLGGGRGLRLPEATRQVMEAFHAGGGALNLYLTHPVRTHTVAAGESLSSVAAAYGMTSWHLLQANPDIDANWLNVGQELAIPSQDELTPLLPVPGKRIVISIEAQHLLAYENGRVVFDWPISTGIEDSPTHPGVFQILSKELEAYASRWDLWMPHFMAIYAAGNNFYNGLHGLPTLSSGVRLWEGLLGRPASYGCIILGLEEAEALYNWAELGVVVVIEYSNSKYGNRVEGRNER